MEEKFFGNWKAIKKAYDENTIRRVFVDHIRMLEEKPAYEATFDAFLFPLARECIILNGDAYPIIRGQAILISRGTKLQFKMIDGLPMEHINLFFERMD